MSRPLKFKTPKELKSKIDAYFAQFDNPADKRITITGLALALGTSRETLCNYEKKDEFFDTIKEAKNRVALSYELTLRERGNAGDIFGLKNMGWKDTHVHAGDSNQPLIVQIVNF